MTLTLICVLSISAATPTGIVKMHPMTPVERIRLQAIEAKVDDSQAYERERRAVLRGMCSKAFGKRPDLAWVKAVQS